MDYSVGDIVWVVLTRRPGLVVLQISEQITKRSLAGEETIYHLIPMNAKEKKGNPITLDQIPGDIYKSSEEARAAMIQAATSAIDEMIDDANRAMAEKLGDQPQEEKFEFENPDALDEPDYVILPDGTKAKINIPDEVKGAIS